MGWPSTGDVVPEQLLLGNAQARHLATMHGGIPTSSESHRVIAIYDERTQRQAEGADVAARTQRVKVADDPNQRSGQPPEMADIDLLSLLTLVRAESKGD